MTYQNQKILLVDDDPSFARLYSKAFQARGFNFSVAATGSQAIEKINLEKPKLILLDIMLPDINGFELLQRIKHDPESSLTPVWMISNLGDQSAKNKSKSLGALKFIEKASTTPNQVCAKITSLFYKNESS